MRFHSQNLTDGRLPLWRHGRCWWGKNWHAEWMTFDWRLGCTLHTRRCDGDGWTLCLHVLIASFYIGRGEGGFFGYSYGIALRREDWAICLDFGTNDSEWSRDFPWYRKGIRLPIKEWITGDPKFEMVDGEPVACVVPMPEGCYHATAKPRTCTWTYRFGIKRVRKSWDLSIADGGIPFEGKGENSWDCGEDGLCGIGGDTLETAIGNAVASVLKSRRRYGETAKSRGKVVYANA